MIIKEIYQLRKNIMIQLCSDGFIRVLKKNPKNRFEIEPLYAVSKTQGVVLLLFSVPNMLLNVSDLLMQIYDIEAEESKKVVLKIVEKFSGILEECSYADYEIHKDNIEFKKIKKILTSEIKNPNEMKAPFNRSKVPSSLVVFISDVCKCDCVYCRVDSGINNRKPQFISKDIIMKIAVECEALGIKDVELTGGDPLMHPDFVDILKVFSKHSVPILFSTKCPIDKTKLFEMKKSGTETLQVSLDSIENKVFVHLTRTSSQYLKNILETVKQAVLLKMKVKVKSVITRINIDCLADMIVKLYAMGVSDFIVQQLSYGDREFSIDLMPTEKQYCNLENDLNSLMERYKDLNISKAYNIEYLFSPIEQKRYFRQYCMAGRRGIAIQVDGSYAFCGQSFNPELRFLNVLSTDILTAWNSNELHTLICPQRELFENTKCFDCEGFEMCLGKRCYIRTYNKWGKIYDMDPLCPYFTDK